MAIIEERRGRFGRIKRKEVRSTTAVRIDPSENGDSRFMKVVDFDKIDVFEGYDPDERSRTGEWQLNDKWQTLSREEINEANIRKSRRFGNGDTVFQWEPTELGEPLTEGPDYRLFIPRRG